MCSRKLIYLHFYLRIVYVMKTTGELLIYFTFGCILVFQVVSPSVYVRACVCVCVEGRCIGASTKLHSLRDDEMGLNFIDFDSAAECTLRILNDPAIRINHGEINFDDTLHIQWHSTEIEMHSVVKGFASRLRSHFQNHFAIWYNGKSRRQRSRTFPTEIEIWFHISIALPWIVDRLSNALFGDIKAFGILRGCIWENLPSLIVVYVGSITIKEMELKNILFTMERNYYKTMDAIALHHEYRTVYIRSSLLFFHPHVLINRFQVEMAYRIPFLNRFYHNYHLVVNCTSIFRSKRKAFDSEGRG